MLTADLFALHAGATARHDPCMSHFGVYTWLCIHMWLFVPVSFLQLRRGCFHEDGSILV